jgi:hypothetical protein
MAFDPTALLYVGLVMLAAGLFVVGGVRFRRWAVEGRAGVPRYSANVETILLWLVYSVGISIAIVVVRQTLRHL